MTIEFCLPAVAVGNIADWASIAVAIWAALIAAVAVMVGVAGAAATVWVAMLAHRTSQRATEIASRAAQIAQQQHDESVNLRRANARIVGRLLLNEVCDLPQRLYTIHVRSGRLTFHVPGQAGVAFDVSNIEQALRESRRPMLPGAEKSESRIHTLPDRLGDDLATLIGYSRTLMATSDALVEHLQPLTNGQPPAIAEMVYGARANAIESYRG